MDFFTEYETSFTVNLNILSAVMNYYMLPLSHQLADFPSDIMYHACVHCIAAISSLYLGTAADVTAWQVDRRLRFELVHDIARVTNNFDWLIDWLTDDSQTR